MAQIPLWDNTIFQTDTGVSYRCPRLMRMGVYQVGDMMVGDRIAEDKVSLIAQTWRELYRKGIQWMQRQRDGGKKEMTIGRQCVSVDQWTLKNVSRALAAASRPEERQSPEVWAVLDMVKAPWRFKSFVRQALWKKLAVNSRLQQKGIRDSNRCPLCTHAEDHEHSTGLRSVRT